MPEPLDDRPSRSVDVSDPDYLINARVFNAITRHPDMDLLFSSRRRVTEKVITHIWREVRAERRRTAMRGVLFVLRRPRFWMRDKSK
jgi:hypothetical protein